MNLLFSSAEEGGRSVVITSTGPSEGKPVICAVLNRVDLLHNPYYYSQYYRREYSDHYQSAS